MWNGPPTIYSSSLPVATPLASRFSDEQLLPAHSVVPPSIENVTDFHHFSFFDLNKSEHTDLSGKKSIHNPPIPTNPPPPLPRHETFDEPVLFEDDQQLFDYLAQPHGFIHEIETKFKTPIRQILFQLTRPESRSGIGFAQRLHIALPIWRDIFHAPRTILDGIAYGFKLPWNCPREELPRIPPCHINYPANQVLLGKTLINRLLSLDIVGEQSEPGWINLIPFFIPKEGGGPDEFRFLVNGSPVSPYLDDLPFSLDQLFDFLKLCIKGDFLFHLDMVDAYYLVGVHPIDYTFLVFPFPNGKGGWRYIYFKRLPQGIKCSGAIFNSTMIVPDKFFKQQTSLPHFSYLDDKGAVVGHASDSLLTINRNIAYFCGVYAMAGGLLSWRKTRAYARTSDKILGHVVYTLPEIAAQITSSRWHKLQAVTEHLLSTPKPSFRAAGRLGGSGQSSILAIPDARIHLRYTYNFTTHALLLGWDGCGVPDSCVISEWLWWKALLASPPQRRILNFNIPIFPPVDWQGFTDASCRGKGGTLEDDDFITEEQYQFALRMHAVCKGKFGFNLQERQRTKGVTLCTAHNLLPSQYNKSSTLRELLAILHLLRTFIVELAGLSIRLFVDNAAVVAILKNGSNKLDCQEVALQINSILSSNNISMQTFWVPRSCNTEADFLSNYLDLSDYILMPETFSRISAQFRVRCTVDLFANNENRQFTCQHFVSELFQPNCSEVDALSFDWSSLFNFCYAFPPVNILVDALLRLLRMGPITVILIVSLWRNHDHMSILFPDGRHFRPEVQAFALLERGVDIQLGPVGRPRFLQEPLQGHRYQFAAILWDTRCEAPHPPPISHFRHRFCLSRHYNEPCPECSTATQ